MMLKDTSYCLFLVKTSSFSNKKSIKSTLLARPTLVDVIGNYAIIVV